MSARPTRVVLVDDSDLCRALLREVLEQEGDIEVVAEAGDGHAAVTACARHAPELVTMDIQMPGAGGLSAIETIMAEHPVPILVVTGQPTGPGSDLVFQAVRRGALDVAEKPSIYDGKVGADLRRKVRTLARVPVVRHIGGRHAPAAAPWPPPEPAGAQPVPVLDREMRGAAHGLPTPLVAVVASAGGPAAIAAIVSELPTDFAAAIALVQHLPIGFTEPFVRFLRGATRLPVSIVNASTDIRPGVVFVATDDRHLVVASPTRLRADSSPPLGGHRPSGTVLFRSVARVLGSAGIGVVLTGIGDDGAEGLAEMRARGALTLAQDAATATVYGMPQAAVRAGAAARTLGLRGITDALRRSFDPRLLIPPPGRGGAS